MRFYEERLDNKRPQASRPETHKDTVVKFNFVLLALMVFGSLGASAFELSTRQDGKICTLAHPCK